MLFGENAVITDLWVQKAHFREGKTQFVSGRPFHSLSLRLGGEVMFEVDGKQFSSTENGITFIPAGVHYITQVLRGGTMIVVHFETKDSAPEARPLFLSDHMELKNMFTDLCDNYSLDGENKYQCMSLFYAILATLCKPQQAVPRRIKLAKNWMDTRFSETITIASLANKAGVSEVHFRNEFKRCYGVSPLTYLKRVRIDNAKQLLRSGYYTVTDVALECGFESISYFSYEFKRLTGITPKEYLRSLQAGE